HLTIGLASSGSLIPPKPISPISHKPCSANCLKSSSTNPFSNIRAPACTLIPLGRYFLNDLYVSNASALTPSGSSGLPGVCTSPAEIIDVTPPCTNPSKKFELVCLGV